MNRSCSDGKWQLPTMESWSPSKWKAVICLVLRVGWNSGWRAEIDTRSDKCLMLTVIDATFSFCPLPSSARRMRSPGFLVPEVSLTLAGSFHQSSQYRTVKEGALQAVCQI